MSFAVSKSNNRVEGKEAGQPQWDLYSAPAKQAWEDNRPHRFGKLSSVCQFHGCGDFCGDPTCICTNLGATQINLPQLANLLT
jgi:hypothetical protein